MEKWRASLLMIVWLACGAVAYFMNDTDVMYYAVFGTFIILTIPEQSNERY